MQIVLRLVLCVLYTISNVERIYRYMNKAICEREVICKPCIITVVILYYNNTDMILVPPASGSVMSDMSMDTHTSEEVRGDPYIYTGVDKCNVKTEAEAGDGNLEETEYSEYIESRPNIKVQDTTETHTRLYTATLDCEHNVKMEDDPHVCDIHHACIIDGERLVITDANHSNIKMFDSSYNFICCLNLTELSEPYAICGVGSHELALTLCAEQRVQFVSANDKSMSLTTSFEVNRMCRGICYSKNELFVCCGGDCGEGPGHVRVYDTAGSLLRVLLTDQHGHQLFALPVHVITNGSNVYVADWDRGLISMDKNGYTQCVVSDLRSKNICDVCEDEQGHIFVCDAAANNIIQLDRQCNVVQVLLDRSDGIRNPSSVTYLHNTRQLLVTCYRLNTIKVVQLTIPHQLQIQ